MEEMGKRGKGKRGIVKEESSDSPWPTSSSDDEAAPAAPSKGDAVRTAEKRKELRTRTGSDSESEAGGKRLGTKEVRPKGEVRKDAPSSSSTTPESEGERRKEGKEKKVRPEGEKKRESEETKEDDVASGEESASSKSGAGEEVVVEKKKRERVPRDKPKKKRERGEDPDAPEAQRLKKMEDKVSKLRKKAKLEERLLAEPEKKVRLEGEDITSALEDDGEMPLSSTLQQAAALLSMKGEGPVKESVVILKEGDGVTAAGRKGKGSKKVKMDPLGERQSTISGEDVSLESLHLFPSLRENLSRMGVSSLFPVQSTVLPKILVRSLIRQQQVCCAYE